jgi:cytochrome c oxidase subunit IV
MHLRWDSPFNGIILISAMFFVALFIGIALMDSREYAENYNPPGTIERPTVVAPRGY